MKRLIFRLSSLGDIVLSQSILEPPYSGETHWVVAKEFEPLIAGRPGITKVWVFDRNQDRSLSDWLRFLKAVRAENFTEVLDAHATLRTRIARIYFRLGSSRARWKTLSKDRTRRLGYILLKRLWPRGWRPTHLSIRCARLAGGYGNERPNLRWMITPGKTGKEKSQGPRIALVPGSAWTGKEWPVQKYETWVAECRTRFPNARFTIFGSKQDEAANRLRDQLCGQPAHDSPRPSPDHISRSRSIYEDAVGKYSLEELATALSTHDLTVGGDTGLLHLSEAVGTPVVAVFGPTRHDFGFGPQDDRSESVETLLWCSPCSKDGTLCFRTTRRFACLAEVGSHRVNSAAERVIARVLPRESGPEKRGGQK